MRKRVGERCLKATDKVAGDRVKGEDGNVSGTTGHMVTGDRLAPVPAPYDGDAVWQGGGLHLKMSMRPDHGHVQRIIGPLLRVSLWVTDELS